MTYIIKKINMELNEAEQFHFALNEHAIVSTTDLGGNITYVNQKFCEISGYSENELLGQNHRILNSKKHDTDFFTEMWQVIATGKTWHGNICNKRKDGEFYWVESSITPILNDSGKTVKYISIRTDITDIKELEVNLAKSEKRHRDSQKFANIGTWDWDIKTGNLYWSEQIGPLFGYKQGDLQNTYENFLSAIHVDDKQAVTDAVDNCITNNVDYCVEYRCVWPDGTIHWLYECGDVVRDNNGKPLRMLGLTQDITKRKEFEIKLENSESRLAKAQRMARMGNWEWDLKTNRVYWSDEMYGIYGYDNEEKIINSDLVNKFIHPDDYNNVKLHEETVKSGVKDKLRYRIVRNDGVIRYVLQHAEIKYNSNNKPCVILGITHDITEQVELETKLSHQKTIFESMFRDALDTLVMTDINRKIIMVNPAFTKLFGYEQEEVIGRTTQFLYKNSDEYLNQGKKQFNIKSLTNLTSGQVIEFKHKNGNVFISHTIGSILKEPKGNIIGFLGHIRDITKEKQDELLIIASKEEAEKANHAKSEFLSSMSHELRTPMNAILGFSQLLEMNYENNLSKEQKADVLEIKHAGEHLLDLINDVLDLSKIESGGINIVLEDVDYLDLVMECRAIIKPIANKRGVSINILDEDIYADSRISLTADKIRLRQVLLNLLSNSVKYNKYNGFIDIKIEKNKHDIVRISIIDNGIGISEKNLQKLFTPFQRFVDDTYSVEGTGIGLVISKRLIELMGGRIGVTSDLRKGSVFWFEINVNTTPENNKNTIKKLNYHEEYNKTDNYCIVYIEDNPANLRLVSKLLSKRENITLITAPNPEIGLELIKVHLPQLILLDINLPGMNGYQVLNEIKNNINTVNTPVIALSANAMQSEIDYAYRQGFIEYLTKPLDILYFYDVIDKCRKKNSDV